MIPRQRGRAICLFVIAAIVLGSGLGLREPWPPDEPRFALIAKEMAASGDCLIPRIGGGVYADKPPLFFWAVAGIQRVIGSMKVALLLPAFVSGLVVLWLVYDLARRLWNPETAIWAGAALLAIVQFPQQMKSGQIDGFLCLWTTLGLYALCRHLLLGPCWGWYAAAGLFCALGVLAKGVGFLPFLILVPYAFAASRRWTRPAIANGGLRWALAPLALLLGIAAWLVPMLLLTGSSEDPALGQYRDEILFRQTVERFGEAYGGHRKPPWYLIAQAMPLVWFPMSFLLPWLVAAWIRDLRRRDAVTLLLGGWMLLVLTFFSIGAGKRTVYLLPAVPALALLAAPHLPALLRRIGVQRLLFGLGLLLATIMVTAGIYALLHPRALQPWFDQPAIVTRFAWIVIGLGLAALAAVLVPGVRRAPLGMAAMLGILWVIAPNLVFPVIDAARSGRTIVDAAARHLGDDERLGFAGWKEQFLLQWNRPAVHFGFRRRDRLGESEEAARWLTDAGGRRLLIPERMIRPCFHEPALQALGFAHGERWYLASASSVTRACGAR